MDPLSTTAGIIAVIQLSSDIVKYIIGATGATTARRTLREEILSCESILLQIQDHIDDADGNTTWVQKIKTLQGPGTPLYRFEIILETLKAQLAPRRGVARALSALKWPFDEKEMERLIAAIQREKSLLQLALTNNCIELIQEIKRASDQNHTALLELIHALKDQSSDTGLEVAKLNTVLLELQESQGYVLANLADLRKHHVDLEQQLILDWITPIDFAAQQSDLIIRSQAGTGKWLIDSPEFQEWTANNNKTLFCPGIPGAGKTILTSVVVDNLHAQFDNDSDIGIAHLYCDFKRAEDQTLKTLLSSLLKQLVQKQRSLPPSLLSLYDRHKSTRKRLSIDEISTTLRYTAATYSQVFVVIDALDECSAHTSSMLISEILDLQATCAVNIFATSRFIPGITERFEHALKLEIRASKQDVCTYIDNHMLRLPSFVKRDGELQDEIKNEIFKAADGMFLLAKLHLDSLIGKRSLKAVRQALKILPSGSNALHQAYRDAMSRIESQVPDQIELAKQVLLWISCSKRPLTTSELQHALAVEVGKDEIDPENFPHVEDMVSACAGLVTVDEQSKIVRLVHHTTQEFFEQMQTHWFPNAHNDIATVCITYLLFSVFDAGFCQSESECEESLLLNSLYDYAAHHWGHHARAAAIETSDLVLEFLQSEPKVSRCGQVMLAAKDYYQPNDNSQTVARLVTGMHLAAYFGLRDTVVALLAIGNEPDPWDTDGRTPLSYAAARGHEAVVALLLANKSMSPDTKDLVHGWTPLWHAVVGAQVAVVKLLLDNDAVDPNCISHHGRTPLSWAAEKGCDAIVSLLVDNEQVHLNAIDHECGWTPLCWAAGNGHPEVIKLLLGKPEVDPNAKDIEYGRTALSWAAERGHKAAVKALVTANQVELNSKSKYGRTPLWFAKERGHREIIDLLLSHNAVDPCLEYSEYGQIPLWYAAEIGHEATVKLLLDSGGHPNMKSEFGRTPLSHAAERGHEVIVRLLLGDGKADPDIKDSVYERTPLSWAAANGHESVVKLLLHQKSVKPDSKSKHGTPLSWAARFGHEAAVRLLLAKDNVNPDSKCHCQRTPLSYAAEKGHEAIVKLLLGRSEVNPSSKDSKYGRTPLSWARVNRQEAIVKLLKENF